VLNGIHAPELEHIKRFSVYPSARPVEKKRPLGLYALHAPHQQAKRRQNEQTDRQGDHEIEAALGHSIDRILQWLRLENQEMPASLLHRRHFPGKASRVIIMNEKTNAFLLTNLHDGFYPFVWHMPIK